MNTQPQPNPAPAKTAPTTLEATYRTTRQILAALTPLAGLAERTAGTETEDGWAEVLMTTLQALLEGQARLRESLEDLHTRLDSPSIDAALRAAVRD